MTPEELKQTEELRALLRDTMELAVSLSLRLELLRKLLSDAGMIDAAKFEQQFALVQSGFETLRQRGRDRDQKERQDSETERLLELLRKHEGPKN